MSNGARAYPVMWSPGRRVTVLPLEVAGVVLGWEPAEGVALVRFDYAVWVAFGTAMNCSPPDLLRIRAQDGEGYRAWLGRFTPQELEPEGGWGDVAEKRGGRKRHGAAERGDDGAPGGAADAGSGPAGRAGGAAGPDLRGGHEGGR